LLRRNGARLPQKQTWKGARLPAICHEHPGADAGTAIDLVTMPYHPLDVVACSLQDTPTTHASNTTIHTSLRDANHVPRWTEESWKQAA
jgi:hypothetical protein